MAELRSALKPIFRRRKASPKTRRRAPCSRQTSCSSMAPNTGWPMASIGSLPLKRWGWSKLRPLCAKAGNAILYAVGANASHGLKRTNRDKRNAMMLLLKDPEWSAWSDWEISRICAVTHPFVGKIRASLVTVTSEPPAARTYTTKHGTTATMKTANIGGKPAPAIGCNTAVPAAGEWMQADIEDFTPRPLAWHPRPRAGPGEPGFTTSETEVPKFEIVDPFQPDGELGGGVAVRAALDVGVLFRMEIAELTGGPGEIGSGDAVEAQFAQRPRGPPFIRDCINLAHINFVTSRLAEVVDPVSVRFRAAFHLEAVGAGPADIPVGARATHEDIVAVAAGE